MSAALLPRVLDGLGDNELAPCGMPPPLPTVDTTCDSALRPSKDVKEAVSDLLSQLPPMRLQDDTKVRVLEKKGNRNQKRVRIWDPVVWKALDG